VKKGGESFKIVTIECLWEDYRKSKSQLEGSKNSKNWDRAVDKLEITIQG